MKSQNPQHLRANSRGVLLNRWWCFLHWPLVSFGCVVSFATGPRNLCTRFPCRALVTRWGRPKNKPHRFVFYVFSQLGGHPTNAFFEHMWWNFRKKDTPSKLYHLHWTRSAGRRQEDATLILRLVGLSEGWVTYR